MITRSYSYIPKICLLTEPDVVAKEKDDGGISRGNRRDKTLWSSCSGRERAWLVRGGSWQFGGVVSLMQGKGRDNNKQALNLGFLVEFRIKVGFQSCATKVDVYYATA
jgi:hypothetical protein